MEQARYDEKVSLADHRLQTAELASGQQADPEIVAAALLHDLGHFMLAEARGHEEFRTVDWEHDRFAAEWIRPRFESETWFDAAIALRRCDDDGKVAGLEIAPLTSYEPLLRSLLR